MLIKCFNKCCHDIALSLENEYKNNNDNTLIIIGAWADICRQGAQYVKKYYNVDKLIIFNSEVYNSKFFNDIAYINILKESDEVWDYDIENIKHLTYIRSDIKLHILQPFINIPQSKKTIDVLFYGAINERRNKILNALINKGINVKILTYGNNACFDNKQLNNYISKSKILLNIHFYEAALQEQARMCRWINNGTIISEKSINNYFNVIECNYNDIVETVISALKSQ